MCVLNRNENCYRGAERQQKGREKNFVMEKTVNFAKLRLCGVKTNVKKNCDNKIAERLMGGHQ